MLLADDVYVTPRRPDAPGYAAWSPSLELAVVSGRASEQTVQNLAEHVTRGAQVVCDSAQADHVAATLPSLLSEPATFFSLPPGVSPAVPGDGAPVRVIERAADVDLRHLPAGLAAEMDAALKRTFVSMAFVDGLPVSFCYPHHQSERHWDVSVDTIEGHRRAGHAARAFGAAHEHLLVREGKLPVWGALASNEASVQMAERLGFQPVVTRHLLIAAGAAGGDRIR